MQSGNVSDQIRARHVDLGHITLNVRESGQGPLMIFLHGITSNAAVFDEMTNRLSSRYRTVAVDQRGHGLSDKPDAGYEANDFADDVAALIEKLDQGPAIIVGHSLGARNGVTAAVRRPDLVDAVVAIDFTPFIEDGPLDSLESRVNGGDQLFKDRDAVEAYLSARYPKIPVPAIKVRAATAFQEVEGGLRPLASANSMSQTAKGLRADLVPAFRDVKKPVLIIRGDESKLVSAEALEKTRELRPDLPVVVIPNVDHYVNEGDLDATLEAMDRFLRQS